MNSIKLQDTKLIYRNVWPFYTVKTNYQKEKNTIPFIIASKRKKRNVFDQGGEKPKHYEL